MARMGHTAANSPAAQTARIERGHLAHTGRGHVANRKPRVTRAKHVTDQPQSSKLPPPWQTELSRLLRSMHAVASGRQAHPTGQHSHKRSCTTDKVSTKTAKKCAMNSARCTAEQATRRGHGPVHMRLQCKRAELLLSALTAELGTPCVQPRSRFGAPKTGLSLSRSLSVPHLPHKTKHTVCGRSKQSQERGTPQ